MPCQLSTDCLSEIFEYLEEDKITLHSCLLVNRFWCKISVRILWRDIWRFEYSINDSHQLRVDKSIVSTLIACLPNESMVLLCRNEIFIPTPTSKPPLFNYASFCKVLSINEIGKMIDNVFENEQPIISLSLNSTKSYLVAKEIIKMFMSQISSLKKLIYFSYYSYTNISFACFPGASDCLTNLSSLHCSSNTHYDQLSQICHNLQSLSIDIETFDGEISNELEELISLQNNLKNLNLLACEGNSWKNIIPALAKHHNSLTKLHLYGVEDNLPLSFIALFSNLQEIKLSFTNGTNFEDFKKLQNVIFPKLKILKIPYQCPKLKYVMKFLENNGKYLEEFHIGIFGKFLNSSITKFCPNLKRLSLILFTNNDELDILKTIFNGCKYLESISVWCGTRYLSEKEILEAVAKYSPKSFCELKILCVSSSKLSSEDLESFFISWTNRTSKKSLTLIIIDHYYNDNDYFHREKIEIIEKYKNLGAIKKFEIKELSYNEEEEFQDRYY